MSTSGRGQVLMPWPNRLQGGAYEFGGGVISSHSTSRRPATRSTASSAGRTGRSPNARETRECQHDLHPRPGYPFSLELAIEYSLSQPASACRRRRRMPVLSLARSAAALIRISRSARRRSTRVLLHAPGSTVLHSDEHGIPTARQVDGTEHDFRRPRPIGTTKLDHAFTDLERDADGVARVELVPPDGGAGLVLWVDEATAS